LNLCLDVEQDLAVCLRKQMQAEPHAHYHLFGRFTVGVANFAWLTDTMLPVVFLHYERWVQVHHG